MKICSKCKVEKLNAYFSERKSSKDGLHTICRSCLAEYYRSYEAKNAEKKRAQRMARYAENGEQIREKSRQSYHKNAEVNKAQKSKYRANNKDRIAEKNREWRLENAEHLRLQKQLQQKEKPWRSRAATSKRRAAQRQATPKWADLQAIALIYKSAAQKQADEGVTYHVDHIVPLCGKNVCGLHVVCNLQVIPAYDNQSKGNRYQP